MNAVEQAKQLKEDFKDFLVLVNQETRDVSVSNLKIRINWHMTYEEDDNECIEKYLEQLDSKSTTEEVLTWLIRRKFVGYLNYNLIKVVYLKVSKSHILQQSMEEYEKKYEAFLKLGFSSSIEIFKDPDLAPSCPVGLPSFSIRLGTPWNGASIYSWKEFIMKRFSWPPDLLIIDVEKNCVIITYAVLPFFKSSVLRDFEDPTVLRELEENEVIVDLRGMGTIARLAKTTKEDTVKTIDDHAQMLSNEVH